MQRDHVPEFPAEPHVAAKRLAQPSLSWQYVNVIANEWNPGVESECGYEIQRKVGTLWVTDTLVAGKVNLRVGSADLCPRGTLDAVGRCLPKMSGCPVGPSNGTNPCDGATGNKFEVEPDYAGEGYGALQFTRYYNSRLVDAGPMGHNWRSNWDRYVRYSVSTNRALVFRASGKALTYSLQSGQWVSDADVRETLVRLSSGGNPSGWELRTTDGAIETYDVVGRLIAETNPAGQVTRLSYDATTGKLMTVTSANASTLTFTYDGQGRRATMRDQSNRLFTFSYDAGNRLLSVVYPDAKDREYRYENANYVTALTAIVDENNALYATFDYDPSTGAVILSKHGVDQHTHALSYPSATETRITDAAGNVTVYTYGAVQQGVLPLVRRELLVAGGKFLEQSWDADNRRAAPDDKWPAHRRARQDHVCLLWMHKW